MKRILLILTTPVLFGSCSKCYDCQIMTITTNLNTSQRDTTSYTDEFCGSKTKKTNYIKSLSTAKTTGNILVETTCSCK